MDFKGKTALITGAGKGIGRDAALLMAEHGAKVVALSRTPADLESLEARTGCRTVAVDLGDPVAARSAARAAGDCDFLVNCAGVNVLEPFLDATDAGYETILGINLRASLIVAQEFARARIAAGGGGAIVNVSSIAAHRGFAQHCLYAASKAGLEGATRVMAKELGPHGIRVNAVAPTITMTELAAHAWSDPSRSEPMMMRHPLNRFADVRDVSRAIALLLHDSASMITGTVLPVDGGFLAV